jgi:membrane fusion protein, multidrug efflux system
MIFRTKAVWTIAMVLGISLLALARILTAPQAPSTGGKGGGGGKGTGPAAGREMEVSILEIRPQPLSRKVLSSGTLLAHEEVDLKSEAGGRILGLRFKEGSKVRKGDLLVKINDAEIRAQLRKVEHQLKLSAARESRQEILASRDLVSKEEHEIALAEKNSLLADRDMLRAQLAKTEIHAPFDGVVGLKEVSEGSNITAGTRIAGLFSLDPLKIDFSIPEQYFGQVKPGDSIRIEVEGLSGPVKGKVYAIEPKIDPATRMLRIRGYCPNGEGLIPPGASARVELPLRTVPDAILVPSNAVMPDIRGLKVMLYKGGKAVSVPVTSRYRTEDRIHVEGLAAGDSLIVSGLIQLKPGSRVKVAGAEKTDAAGGAGKAGRAQRE